MEVEKLKKLKWGKMAWGKMSWGKMSFGEKCHMGKNVMGKFVMGKNGVGKIVIWGKMLQSHAKQCTYIACNVANYGILVFIFSLVHLVDQLIFLKFGTEASTLH